MLQKDNEKKKVDHYYRTNVRIIKEKDKERSGKLKIDI